MLTTFEWACLFEFHKGRNNAISDIDYELLYAIGDLIAITTIGDLQKIDMAETALKNIVEIKKNISLCKTVEEVNNSVNDSKLYLNILEEIKLL